MKKSLIALIVLLISITSIQLWVTQDRTTQKKEMDQAPGEADIQIGGPFTLVDQNGKTVHDTDYHGHVTLVFFGFTHCPDICPVTVATLSKTMEALGESAAQVTPIFVSVDWENDTPAIMKDYLANFDKRMVGLTGSQQQIIEAAQSYKIYYAKNDDSESPPQKEADKKETDYTIDHSGYIYMMGKDGKYVRIFPYNATEQEIAHAVEHYLSQ